MRISLTTQTPVHIGTGLSYYPNEYIKTQKDGRRFFRRIDHSRFGDFFSESQREEFALRMEDAAYGRPFSLTEFMFTHKINSTPLSLYRLKNNSGEKEPKEIRECIKTGGVPYIPGSSIKGALRTALLWWQAKSDETFIESIRGDLQDRRKSHKREIGNEYVASVFSLRPKEKGRYDPKYDLLRFLQVSDCMPEQHDLSVEGIRTYSLRYDTLSPKEYTVAAECVTGTFNGSIGGLDQIQRLLKTDELPFLSKKMSLLGIQDLGEVNNVAPHLEKVLIAWNRWCLEHEKTIPSEDRSGQCMKPLDNVETWLKESAHLRLGFSVGTLYQTLIGILEEEDPDLAREIINLHRLGKIPRNVSGGNLDPPYPKSIEFTNAGEPMGWVSVKMVNS